MPFRKDLALDQVVPGLGAECRNVDGRQRIGGLKPDPGAGRHASQPFLRPQGGQGAFQPLEVVDFGSVQGAQLPNMLAIR